MTALYGCSRSVLFGIAALTFVFGVTLLAAEGPGTGGVFITLAGGGLIIVLLFERTRYRSEVADRQGEPIGPGGGEPPGPLEPRFAPSSEVFVDPSTGRRMRVFVDPRTGERRYLAED
jgi:hypothetical protein